MIESTVAKLILLLICLTPYGQASSPVPVTQLAHGLNASLEAYMPLVATRENSFSESFAGSPAHPTPWAPTGWDVTVHARSTQYYALRPMQAAHGTNCEAPPATHRTQSFEGAVYQCRDHVMTAISEAGYGVIYLTPNHLVDFSNGEAVVRFDMSTARTSVRDWVDIWITPYENNLQLPLHEWLPDLNGEPRNAVHIEMRTFMSQTVFAGNVIRDFDVQGVDGNDWTGYEQFLTPSAMERTTFELRISNTRLKFGIPEHDFWWIDTSIAPLGWQQGVVQLGHHSYTPEKDCSSCGPNTWHWDNVVIEPAVPFVIMGASRRYADASAPSPVEFAYRAPGHAHLRFAGIGRNLQVSFDGGQTWTNARPQAQRSYNDGTFWSYWMPIPPGADSVLFRGEDWGGGKWHVRDISVWSRG